MIKQLTREEAVKFHDDKTYAGMTFKEKAGFQINQEKLCMPFSIFHEAVEKTIGRPVFTHELGLNADGIKAEIEKVN
jgi:hypothetical protein